MQNIPWQGWALMSAGFAALTAIFGKIGVELVAIAGVIFLGEHLSGWNWLGIVMIAGRAAW